MKAANIFSRLFGILGSIVLLGGIVLCFWFQGRDEGQRVPREAAQTAQRWMDALSQGDLTGASRQMYTQPDLAPSLETQDTLADMLWQAYEKSLSCTAKDLCRASAAGAVQDAVITALDLEKTWQNMEDLAGAKLAQSDPGDRTEAGREQAALEQAAREVLAGSCPTVSRDVSLTLIFRDGRWWVAPDAALEKALACGLGD